MADDARRRGAADEELAALERLTALPADPAEPEALAPALARLGELYADAGRGDEAGADGAAGAGAACRATPTALAVLDRAARGAAAVAGAGRARWPCAPRSRPTST